MVPDSSRSTEGKGTTGLLTQIEELEEEELQYSVPDSSGSAR